MIIKYPFSKWVYSRKVTPNAGVLFLFKFIIPSLGMLSTTFLKRPEFLAYPLACKICGFVKLRFYARTAEWWFNTCTRIVGLSYSPEQLSGRRVLPALCNSRQEQGKNESRSVVKSRQRTRAAQLRLALCYSGVPLRLTLNAQTHTLRKMVSVAMCQTDQDW